MTVTVNNLKKNLDENIVNINRMTETLRKTVESNAMINDSQGGMTLLLSEIFRLVGVHLSPP